MVLQTGPKLHVKIVTQPHLIIQCLFRERVQSSDGLGIFNFTLAVFGR